METVKLQKYLSMCGVMSRRAAEAEIEKGKVTVNGRVASLGDRVDPENDTVIYEKRRIRLKDTDHIYIMLNKPVGVVTTMKDEEGRRSVADLITDVPSRVYPIGRLDMYSEGLLLLTDDGELCQRLSHPRSGKEKVYIVTMVGSVSDEKLKVLASPMTITERDRREYKLAPCPVKLIERDETHTTVEMTLREGRNRQIRRMCEVIETKISRLTRISEGGIALGTLPRGKWRYLTAGEIQKLKNI